MPRAVVVGTDSPDLSSVLAALEDSRYEILVLTDIAQVQSLLDPRDVAVVVLDEASVGEISMEALRSLTETVPQAEVIRLRALRSTPPPELSSELWLLERPLHLPLLRKCVRYIRNHSEILEHLRGAVERTCDPETELVPSGEYHIVDDRWFAVLDRLLKSPRPPD